jgi:hypothetical protein
LHVFAASHARAANADGASVGHCQNDTTIPPENIISACTVFIDQAFAENRQLYYVPYALVYEAIANERLGQDEDAEKISQPPKRSTTRLPTSTTAWT